MLLNFIFFSCIFYIRHILPVGTDVVSLQPQQIHLSYGANEKEIIVTWITFQPTNQSLVEYGRKFLTDVVEGNSTVFEDGGTEHRTMFIHRVRLQNLKTGKKYIYHCGSNYGWSALFSFKTRASGSDWSPNLAVFGDLGNQNAQSLPRLQKEAQIGLFDAVLHIGDFAYDMDIDNARVGDEFMRQIEPIAAYVPYMTCVGNHENAYNFSNYANRFSMPTEDGINNFFYSWNIGPAHIVSFSTEYYFYLEYGWQQIIEQYKWLENDLKEANEPANRAKQPWIITMGHRPMYCSNNDSDDCTRYESIIRTGIPVIHEFGLEDLFYKYGVDLELWAHEHSYERLWPIYNRTVYNGSNDNPYTNPKAPVHIITGSAGCWSKHDPFTEPAQSWSAFRSTDYGYTRMTIINSTHLFLQQISDDKGGAIIDKVMLIKDNHGSWTMDQNGLKP
uniref:Purple acid phosphatase n=1 Tax=Hemiscolopendra marginata TaxID=943146 RepID=A0A646QDP2_9MYRI